MNRIIFFSVLWLSILQLFSQEKQKNWTLDGYISQMQSITITDLENINPLPDTSLLPVSLKDSLIQGQQTINNLTGGVLFNNIVHNRLNFHWYINANLNFSIQVRNQLFYGDQIRLGGKPYRNSLGNDPGLFDLSYNILSGPPYALNSHIDRLYFRYTLNNLEITIGRQRINWGQTFVWNPNDIYNNYSFFDFDYPERPGSDAIRFQYYTGMTSSVEFAAKLDSSNRLTVAGLIKTNIKNYDIQFLGGIYNEKDLVLGSGWSGNINATSIRGELGYYHPLNSFSDTAGMWLCSISSDHTFGNNLTLQGEVLFGQIPDEYKVHNIQELISRPLSVKTMAYRDFTGFVNINYTITPLITSSLSIMYFPELKGFYTGPNLNFSITSNLELSCFYQYFDIKQDNYSVKSEKSQKFNLIFLRLKGNF